MYVYVGPGYIITKRPIISSYLMVSQSECMQDIFHRLHLSPCFDGGAV